LEFSDGGFGTALQAARATEGITQRIVVRKETDSRTGNFMAKALPASSTEPSNLLFLATPEEETVKIPPDATGCLSKRILNWSWLRSDLNLALLLITSWNLRLVGKSKPSGEQVQTLLWAGRQLFLDMEEVCEY
jgi:hypothetical protein